MATRPKAPARRLTTAQMAAIHEGVAKAGLKNYRISSVHLRPVTADEVDPGQPQGQGNCHSQQLPNGHWVIVCD